jgi:DNA-binding transcriptional LysR family regulator
MLNIPTDLLRTLVTVVDLRSFTKAAQSLGVTQPAVSAQIKRLQFLLGYELLDKSAPGVSLTPRGQEVVDAARQMLSINDGIARSSGGDPSAGILRIGIPGDFGTRIPRALASFRTRWPHVRFNVDVASFEQLVRGLKQGELDLGVAVLRSEPLIRARHLWLEQPVWARSDATRIAPTGPVPLVSFGEECASRACAAQAINRIGRECDFVFASRGMVSVEAAVVAGLGVLALPRSRLELTSLREWEDAPLPRLPELYCGIFLREGDTRVELEELADAIAAALRPQLRVAESGPSAAVASGAG